MTTTTADLAGLAKAFLQAKAKFNKAYIGYWHTVEPVDDDMGFKILEVFRGAVKTYVFDYARGHTGLEQAAREVFRLVLVEEADYTFEQAVRFVRWYEQLKHRIGRAIGHLYEFRGDSFGDLVDSYPLAGRELVERALASHPRSDRPRREGFLDELEVGNAVLDKLGLQWHKFIVGGENYVASTLAKAAYRAYVSQIRRNESVISEEESHGLTFADHFDD